MLLATNSFLPEVDVLVQRMEAFIESSAGLYYMVAVFLLGLWMLTRMVKWK